MGQQNGRIFMKRSTPVLFALVIATFVVTYLVVGWTPTATAAGRTPVSVARAAAAFDMSPPLSSMEQFIPDKQVVIHPAVVSPAVREGAMKGPGTGLGTTPPTIPAARGLAGAARGGGRAA